MGFADATTGVARRSAVCNILTYIQSVFDFTLMKDTQFIRLYVDTSYSSAFPAVTLKATGTLGESYPHHKTPIGTGIVNGFVHDFIRTGVDPMPADYPAHLKVNFDGVQDTGHRYVYAKDSPL